MTVTVTRVLAFDDLRADPSLTAQHFRDVAARLLVAADRLEADELPTRPACPLCPFECVSREQLVEHLVHHMVLATSSAWANEAVRRFDAWLATEPPEPEPAPVVDDPEAPYRVSVTERPSIVAGARGWADGTTVALHVVKGSPVHLGKDDSSFRWTVEGRLSLDLRPGEQLYGVCDEGRTALLEIVTTPRRSE